MCEHHLFCRSGHGTPLEEVCRAPVEALLRDRVVRNTRLVKGLREDPQSDELLRLCLSDAEAGRMRCPRSIMDADLQGVALSPRFGVEQGGLVLFLSRTRSRGAVPLCAGTKPDGSLKVRPIDDMTRSGCNPCTGASEKLHYESLDLLLATARAAAERFGHSLSLWKADVDAAYRRIPISPAHRQFGVVVFVHQGRHVVAEHLALPFGSIASVTSLEPYWRTPQGNSTQGAASACM